MTHASHLTIYGGRFDAGYLAIRNESLVFNPKKNAKITVSITINYAEKLNRSFPTVYLIIFLLRNQHEIIKKINIFYIDLKKKYFQI